MAGVEMCDAHLGGHPDGLCCDRADEHQTGHTFHGSSVADKHDASEKRAEETRG